MNNFIAIKSKATILKVLNNEMKKAHEFLPEKEYVDVYGWDMQGDNGKIFECGWISALQHIKNEVGKK
jgi:hypothetical protein